LDNDLNVATVLSILILLTSIICVELGMMVAIVEIVLGGFAGDVLSIDPPAPGAGASGTNALDYASGFERRVT
jgi:hypothetical protein